MTSNRQLGLLPECTDQCGSALHRTQSASRVTTYFSNRFQTEVAEFALLGIAEQVLDRIEFGGVTGKALKRDAAVQRLDVFAHQATAMRRQAVPNDQQLALDRRCQSLEEFDQLRRFNGTVEEAEVDAPATGASDQRQLLPGKAVLQDWRAAFGGPGLDARRPFAQSRFVDEDNGSSLAFGVFFSAGQRLVFHSLMARSSRCKARPVGRWLENPSSRTIRHTCVVPNTWPNSRLISVPIRASVHTSVGKPLVIAPAISILLSCLRCSMSMEPGRPSGRRRHACRSPASFFAQIDTVCRLTSHARATSACITPRASICMPRRRRASSSLKSRLYRFVAMRTLRSNDTSNNRRAISHRDGLSRTFVIREERSISGIATRA